MVLLTTYLNAGWPDDPAVVVSDTRVLRMALMMVVFHASVEPWEYAVTAESAFSQAYVL